MKKIFLLLPALLVLALMITGCEEEAAAALFIPSYSGDSLLDVDSAGHFTEDITYSYYNGKIERLNADGTYSQTIMGCEYGMDDFDKDGKKGEGWVEIGSFRGTYTWDPETFLATYIIQEITGDPAILENMGWNLYDKMECSEYFTGRKNSSVYKKSEGTDDWSYIEREYKLSADQVYEKTVDFSLTYTIDTDQSKFGQKRVEFHYTDGEVTRGSKYEEDSNIIKYLPEGGLWEKGNTVSFQVRGDYGVFYDWDLETDSWEFDTGMFHIANTYEFTHQGDVMFIYDTEAERQAVY